MATTIEEQIVSAISTRIEDITSGSFRTDIGDSVQIGIKKTDPSIQVPGCVLFPNYAENEIEQGSTYDHHNLPIEIVAQDLLGRTENPFDLAAAMKADIYEAILGRRNLMPFTNGSAANDTVFIGGTLADVAATYTAIIESVTTTTGTFAGGDAEGTLYVRRLTRNLETYFGSAAVSPGIADFNIGLTVSGQSPETVSTGGLADEIYYEGGGVVEYPEPGESVVAVRMDFRIRFKTLKGNPYQQS